MLVGNHDQVNVQGSVHALEVLRMCNPEKIVVFDEPRVWKGAMWLPYRKDQETMRRTVGDLVRTNGKKEPSIKTVFCHADVLGANVNQTFQIKNGMDSKETFSEEKTGIESIISGHYHKPHFVERFASAIRRESVSSVASGKEPREVSVTFRRKMAG